MTHYQPFSRCTDVVIYCVYTVGQVVHTLPEGEAVFGVTLLADEIFLLRRKNYDQVEVYDVITYRRKRIIAVPNALWLLDMTSCAHFQCVYIVDARNECIFRLDVKGATFKQWNVGDLHSCISVNASHNVVVSCPIVRKIKEFSSHGKLLTSSTRGAQYKLGTTDML